MNFSKAYSYRIFEKSRKNVSSDKQWRATENANKLQLNWHDTSYIFNMRIKREIKSINSIIFPVYPGKRKQIWKNNLWKRFHACKWQIIPVKFINEYDFGLSTEKFIIDFHLITGKKGCEIRILKIWL